MNYHAWIIIENKESDIINPWVHIGPQVDWLINEFGRPYYGLNICCKKLGVWKLTIHCVEHNKIHYRISFKNNDDAVYFKLRWL